MNSRQISPAWFGWNKPKKSSLSRNAFIRHGTGYPMRAEEELHAQAQKCKRLASESLDVFVREALIELASDYEHLAERLKQQRVPRPLMSAI
jgi:hypothetical protein